jgi:hypothetical protein
MIINLVFFRLWLVVGVSHKSLTNFITWSCMEYSHLFQVVAWVLPNPILCGCLQRCCAHLSKLSTDGWKVQQVVIKLWKRPTEFIIETTFFSYMGIFYIGLKIIFYFLCSKLSIYISK